MVKLLSSDQQEFVLEKEIAERSRLIKDMIANSGLTDSAIPLPNVSGPILSKIIEYLNHHKNDPPYQEEDFSSNGVRSDVIEEWDAEFCKVDQGTLFELILAANYMDIKPLLDLTCKTVANMIKGKTPEEIRRTFNIQNDFTPEEEEQIRKENEWCEDH